MRYETMGKVPKLELRLSGVTKNASQCLHRHKHQPPLVSVFQVWEPSDQKQIQAAAEVYVGAGIDHPAGLRFAINIDPAQFEVFSSEKTGRGRNELLQLGHENTESLARRPHVVALRDMVVVVYQHPDSSWAFTTTGLSNASSARITSKL